MAAPNAHPMARKDLVISELPGEAVIYNFADHQAHCVSEIALRVLQRSDGKTSAAKLAAQLREDGQTATDAQVQQAVGELARAGLIELPPPRLASAGRRRALKQLGLTAGLTLAVPMVWSIVAPSVAEAASINCATIMCAMNGSDDGLSCGNPMMAAGICAGETCVPDGVNTCI